jgi:hypothetical protein
VVYIVFSAFGDIAVDDLLGGAAAESAAVPSTGFCV